MNTLFKTGYGRGKSGDLFERSPEDARGGCAVRVLDAVHVVLGVVFFAMFFWMLGEDRPHWRCAVPRAIVPQTINSSGPQTINSFDARWGNLQK